MNNYTKYIREVSKCASDINTEKSKIKKLYKQYKYTMDLFNFFIHGDIKNNIKEKETMYSVINLIVNSDSSLFNSTVLVQEIFNKEFKIKYGRTTKNDKNIFNIDIIKGDRSLINISALEGDIANQINIEFYHIYLHSYAKISCDNYYDYEDEFISLYSLLIMTLLLTKFKVGVKLRKYIIKKSLKKLNKNIHYLRGLFELTER